MDVVMDDQIHFENENESECQSRKNRIKMYRSILNYYKGRSFSLNLVLACKQPSINIPPDMKTHDALRTDMEGIYNDVMLIESIRNSLKLINFSLASTELMSESDNNCKRDIINKIEGIIYFSRSIMKLYNECCNELELIEKMKNYSTVLTEYMESVKNLREKDKNEKKNEYSKEMEKAELQIYKINLMRTMKSILMGYISLNCPDLLKNIQNFKSSFRRGLTVDDFREAWDVGL